MSLVITKDTYNLVIICILSFFSCSLSGQESGKFSVNQNDYHLWSTLQLESVSPKGGWISYSKMYESENDTLFVRNLRGNKQVSLPRASGGVFINEQSFMCRINDSLAITELQSNNRKYLSNVTQYELSGNNLFLVTSFLGSESLSDLSIYDTALLEKKVIPNVLCYKMNRQKNAVFYCTFHDGHYTLTLLELKQGLKNRVVISNNSQPLSGIAWNVAGTAVAFYSAAPKTNLQGDILYLYNTEERRLHILNSQFKGLTVDGKSNYQLTVSDNGNTVFFGTRDTIGADTSILNSVTEVWHSKDKRLYTHRKQMASRPYRQYLAVWHVNENSAFIITDDKNSWAMLGGNQSFVLTADPVCYEPQYKRIGDMDYYLVDSKTGMRSLILKKQSGQSGTVVASPDGNYIAYFTDGVWWMFNRLDHCYYELTGKGGTSWDNGFVDPGDELHPWGNAGWSTDNRWILLYDYYDLWAVSVDGKLRRRLTNGKEVNMQFRLDPSCEISPVKANYSSTSPAMIDLNATLLLKANSLYDGSSGYYNLDFEKGTCKVVFENSEISDLKKVAGKNYVIYTEQTYRMPPEIKCLEGKNTVAVSLVRSNTHLEKFNWGSSQMIHYKNNKGKLLNGALYYPSDYQKGEEYPMVVYIYSKVSTGVNHYINPSIKNTIGFNISNFTTKGYFVLLPDIDYDIGEPGNSATECVSAAVKQVISMGDVNPKKIGLLGHSFGGYECNYIISKTNIFAAAVSGSAVADIVSHYFTINTNSNVQEAWRYESQQYRMGKSFYEAKENYLRNSPIAQAETVYTPILTWVGRNDTNVQSTQALEFYFALRRLGKTNILLRYPDEGHILSVVENQIDLTRRIEDWFNYYLKGSAPQQWMDPK